MRKSEGRVCKAETAVTESSATGGAYKPPPELSPVEVANVLRCSLSQVYKLLDRREFAYRKVGRKYWVSAESVAAYRERTSVGAEPPAPPRPGGYQFKHL